MLSSFRVHHQDTVRSKRPPTCTSYYVSYPRPGGSKIVEEAFFVHSRNGIVPALWCSSHGYTQPISISNGNTNEIEQHESLLLYYQNRSPLHATCCLYLVRMLQMGVILPVATRRSRSTVKRLFYPHLLPSTGASHALASTWFHQMMWTVLKWKAMQRWLLWTGSAMEWWRRRKL